MQKIKIVLREINPFFYLYSVVLLFFFVSDAFRTYQYFQHYQLSSYDFIATYVALFIFLTIPLYIGLFTFYTILTLITKTLKAKNPSSDILLYGWFTLFITVGFIAARLFIRTIGITSQVLSITWTLSIVGLVGLLLSILFKRKIRTWSQDIIPRAKFIILVMLSASAIFFSYYIYDVNTKDDGIDKYVSKLANDSKRPNVIFIILDSFTAQDMSLYGYSLPTTPHLEELAKSWTVYDRAYSSSNLTYYSNISMLTGRYPYFADWSKYGDLIRSQDGWSCLPKTMQHNGWRSISIQHYYYPLIYFHPDVFKIEKYYDEIYMGNASYAELFERITHAKGVKLQKVLELIEYEYFPLLYSGNKDAEYAIAKKVLSSSRASQPIFMVVNGDRPHFPYLADEYLGKFLSKDSGLTDIQSQYQYAFKDYSPNQQPIISKLKLRYDENIIEADNVFYDFINFLKSQGLYENSLIILTGDHGETFRGVRTGHGTYDIPYEEHHVPLVIKYPYQKEGVRIHSVVRHTDIFPTILKECEIILPKNYYGGDVLPKLNNIDTTRIAYTIGFNRGSKFANLLDTVGYQVSAIQGNYKFIDLDGTTYLFDVQHDPVETKNIIDQHPTIAIQLQNAISVLNKRADIIESTEDISLATPLVKRSITGPDHASYFEIQKYDQSQLQWRNESIPGSKMLTSGQLFFGGEKRQSYADITIPSGAENILLQYNYTNQSPNDAVYNYFNFMNGRGERNRLQGIVGYDSTRDTLSQVRLLLPIEKKDKMLRVGIKNLTEDKLISVNTLVINFYAPFYELPPTNNVVCKFIAMDGSLTADVNEDLILDEATMQLIKKRGSDRLFVNAHEGQRVRVKNIGTWQGDKYSGLEFVYHNGRWAADLSKIQPINPNPLFQRGTSSDLFPGYELGSPPGARYTVERIKDKNGDYLHFISTSPLPWFVLKSAEQLRKLENIPITIKVRVRSSVSANTSLQIFDFYTKEKFDQKTSNITGGSGWETLTLHHIMKYPDPQDYCAIGLFNTKPGDWFDIQEFSVYVGWIP
jgi:arylsulfatase A-like enzyme